jgi:diphosphomevalonate decarboxylase
MKKATAVAGSNIALVKYWGNRDARKRLPANNSVSLTLRELTTTTTVAFPPGAGSRDEAEVDGKPLSGSGLERVKAVLDPLRRRAGVKARARVASRNSFPAGAGLASSASAFAALAAAAAAALGLHLPPRELSAAARRGSGSAARSVFGGFAELGTDGTAWPLAPPGHWDLRDVAVVLSREHKKVGSTEGHLRARTSPLYTARLRFVEQALPEVRAAILARDFPAIARLAEADALAMHSVMATSEPPVVYWSRDTLRLLEAVEGWRREGLPCAYTLDAGPNVHILAPGGSAARVASRVRRVVPGADVRVCRPGPGVRLSRGHLF